MDRLTNRIAVPGRENDLIVFTKGKYDDTIPAEMTHDDIRAVLRRLAEYEDFEEIFREKMTDTACEFLKDKEEFGLWLDRNKWDAKKCDEYARAEEQGLLLRLPCKVGDTVWVVTSPFNVFEGIEYNENLCDECYESFISSVTFYKNSVQYRISAKVTNRFIGVYCNEQNFGKTVFLTQAEAEQKLKEMESD